MNYENIDITELLKYSVVEILKRYPDKIIKFEDIISLIHYFVMKMYSKCRKNKLKMIEENLEAEQK